VHALTVIAEPKRLELLKALRSGSKTVGELTSITGNATSVVWTHMQKLLESGAVIRVPVSVKEIRYEINPETFKEIVKELETFYADINGGRPA
jgi:DNA-binding transcriptional ArsR family regulator